MANSWNGPQLRSPIRTDVPELQKKLIALLKGDPTSVADIPSGAKRLVNTSGTQWQVQQYNGSSWAAIGKLMHDVDTLDGYHAAITPAANMVAVRNADKKLEGDITGNATTASSAATLSETLPVNKGGTGATTSEAARSNLGVPPTSHTSTSVTYGAGSDTQYGHLKLSDATDSMSGVSGGVAATPAAVKVAKDAADAAQSSADNAQSSADAAQSAADAAQSAADAAQSTADSNVKTVNGNAPDAAGNITPEQTGCLPLTGGMMSGSVSLSYNGKVAEIFTLKDNGWDYAALMANGSGSPGGSFQAFMANSPNHAGGFTCRAELGNTFYDLYGTPEGILQWAGKNIVRSVNGVNADAAGNVSIEESGTWADDISAGSWIRYQNGIQIISIDYCNGSDQTIWMPFPKPFLFDNRYSAVCMPWNGSSVVTFAAFVSGRTTTGCYFYSNIGVGKACTASGIFIGRWK